VENRQVYPRKKKPVPKNSNRTIEGNPVFVSPRTARSMKKEILTIEEAAAYLQIGKRSIYKLAKEGKLPGKKVLNKWRFEKESLRQWVSKGKILYCIQILFN